MKTQIGYVHHFRHDLDRAIAQFERVVALEPSFAFAHYALGDACTQRGEFDRAIAEFNKSIELGGRSVNHVGVMYNGGRTDVIAFMSDHVFAHIPDPGWAAFAYSVSFTAVCFIPVWMLYRRRIFLKV